MTHGIVMYTTGGPEVLTWTEITLPRLKRNEVRVRHTAVGVNYIDVYDRTGLYARPLPSGLGREAAGVVEELGSGVTSVAVGDRVAYVLSTPGSYAEVRHVPADRLVKLPASISDEQAAAMMLKGLTAQYLLRRTCKVRKGEQILVHAAAGGVGLLLCQWANALGAEVIGVVSSDAKAALARADGAHEVIVTSREDLVTRVRELTRGKGVSIVYDAVGQDTFFPSLDCLRRLGMMVSYGNASGPVAPFSVAELAKRGSLFVTRPSLFDYIATRAELNRCSRELFDVVERGVVKIQIGQRYPLANAAQAHRDLEGRLTTGQTVLTI